MKITQRFAGFCLLLAFGAPTALAEKLVIATVNNGDMIRMQKLTGDFTRRNPGIELEWVTLEETLLRQKVTQDIAAKGGQFDVLTIGTYEVPLWAKKNWLVSLDDLPASWDAGDLLGPSKRAFLRRQTLRGAVLRRKFDDDVSARSFSGQRHLDARRADLGASYEFARALHNPPSVYGICLRGKPSWGENAAFITTLANSFGARWFDENWQPQFDSPAWRHALSFYVDMLQNYGPPRRQFERL